jgi:hypothetical protein
MLCCPIFRILWLAGILPFIPVFLGCNPHTVNKDVAPLVEGNDGYSLQEEGIAPAARWWEVLNDSHLNALVQERMEI